MTQSALLAPLPWGQSGRHSDSTRALRGMRWLQVRDPDWPPRALVEGSAEGRSFGSDKQKDLKLSEAI